MVTTMKCIVLLLLTLSVASGPGDARAFLADDPPRAGEAKASPANAVDPRVEAILTAMQKRGEAIAGVRCKVDYQEDDRLNMVVVKKEGRVLFLKTKGNPLFLIEFSKTVSDGIVSKMRSWYLFNGTSLIEAREKTKHIVERQLVSGDERIDFFDLETAPFPMPFGQKKDDILRHFDVELVAPKKDDPAGTQHLRCTPKADSPMKRRYAKLEFYILTDLHLPRKIVATLPGGYEVTTAVFPDLSESSLALPVVNGKEPVGLTLSKKDFAEPLLWKKNKYTRDIEPL